MKLPNIQRLANPNVAGGTTSQFCSSCETSDRNYVASGTVHVPREPKPVPKRHITPDATEEVKLDGYRAIGVKTSSEAILYSRNGKNFSKRYPLIAEALHDLPPDTVVDGEVVALDDAGRPDFHALQHFQASATRIHYFVFDLLIWKGRDLVRLESRLFVAKDAVERIR